MKIGFLLDDTLDKPDGVQAYVLTLGTWYESQGHEVHYLVGQSGRADVANLHSLSRNIKVRFNRNRLTIPLPARRTKITQLLNKLKLDVLHVQMPYSPQLAGRVIKAAAAHTTVVGTFHILPFGRFEKIASRLLGVFMRPSLGLIDAPVSVSQPAAEFAKSAFGLTTQVVPNAVDLTRFGVSGPQPKDKSGLSIVFLGRLVERKGIIELVNAVDKVQQDLRKQNARLTIYGRGPLAGKLSKLIVNLGLDDIVIMAGFLSEADKPTALAAADIAIFPSISGESFGIVLLEAMAAGRSAVLAGNNPGYSSVMADAPASLFDPANQADFARILQKYINHPSARQRLVKQQQAIVSRYSVEVVGRQLLEIYYQAIAKHDN